MSKLYSFLYPIKDTQIKEILISDRFKDENGNPIPFKIRALTQEENDQLTKKSMKTKKVDGQTKTQVDNLEYARRLIVAATVFPDFSDDELCQECGTLNPLEVPGRVLLSGEYSKLMEAIVDLSGFNNEVIELEAKN